MRNLAVVTVALYLAIAGLSVGGISPPDPGGVDLAFLNILAGIAGSVVKTAVGAVTTIVGGATSGAQAASATVSAQATQAAEDSRRFTEASQLFSAAMAGDVVAANQLDAYSRNWPTEASRAQAASYYRQYTAHMETQRQGKQTTYMIIGGVVLMLGIVLLVVYKGKGAKTW